MAVGGHYTTAANAYLSRGMLPPNWQGNPSAYGTGGSGAGGAGGYPSMLEEYQKILGLHGQQQEGRALWDTGAGFLTSSILGQTVPYDAVTKAAMTTAATDAADAARKAQARQIHGGFAVAGLGRGGGHTSALLEAGRLASQAKQRGRQAVAAEAAKANWAARMQAAHTVPDYLTGIVGLYQPEVETRSKRQEHEETGRVSGAGSGGGGVTAGTPRGAGSSGQKPYYSNPKHPSKRGQSATGVSFKYPKRKTVNKSKPMWAAGGTSMPSGSRFKGGLRVAGDPGGTLSKNTQKAVARAAAKSVSSIF